jgi:hypothetical protein
MSVNALPVNQKAKRKPLYLGVDVPLLITVISLLAF